MGAFYGPTLGQLGADPNSPSITGTDGTVDLSGSSSGDGTFLNTLGSFFSVVGSTVGSTYRAISTPTGPVGLVPGQNYLIPAGSQIAGANILGAGSGNIVLLILFGVLIVAAIKLFGRR